MSQPPAPPVQASPPPPPPPPPHAPPPVSLRRRWARAVGCSIGLVLLVVVLCGGALYGALHTERGTRTAWQLATRLLDGRLAGTLDGGTLDTGLRLRQLAWRDAGTEIRIDRLSARWQLTRAPWRLTLDTLHAGQVDARFAPAAASSTKTALPARLTLPLQLQLRDIRVDRFVLHDGATATEFEHIGLHGSSDGRHHQLTVDSLGTPYGALSGALALDGVRPFALTGNAGFAGADDKQAIRLSVRLAGSLELLHADVDASGLKLAARAGIDATPFAAVPLQTITLAADHLNPQAIDPAAPLADLALRAELRPVPASAVAGTPSGSSTSAPAAPSPTLVVAGPVSIVNAAPGALDARRLPLLDAHATIRLDAHSQSIDGLRIRLADQATVTGSGTLQGGHGTLALLVDQLNLHALYASLRPTRLAGPVGVVLGANGQHVQLDLRDPAARLRLSGDIDANHERTAFDNVKLTSGAGSVQLDGALRRDAQASYAFKAVLAGFDPLSVLAAANAPPAKGTSAKGTSAKGESAKGTSVKGESVRETSVKAVAAPTAASAHTAAATHGAPLAKSAAHRAPGTPIQARVSGTFAVTGALAPRLTSRIAFTLHDSVYDGLPMTGTGTVQLAGTRLLPSDANLSIAGNGVVLHGSFGAPGDRLVFNIDATRLERLGFGLSGTLVAQGDVTGSLAHPDVSASYHAESLAFGENHVGFAQGRVQLHDGAAGAMVFSIDARDVAVAAPGLALDTLSAHLDGTRADHSLSASAVGALRGRRLDLNLAAHGRLTDGRAGLGWDGTVAQLENRGLPQLQLAAPMTLSVAREHVSIGPARLAVEGATLQLTGASYEAGRVQSTGSITGVDVKRMLAIAQELGVERPTLATDLVLDGSWNFSLGDAGTGFVQLTRRAGDISVDAGRGPAALGIDQLTARAQFEAGNRVLLTLAAKAARLGSVNADLQVPLRVHDAQLGLAEDAPLGGHISADLPSLRTTGALLGPQYIVDGKLALRLTVAGVVARPSVSGTIVGDDLAATLVDDGVQFKGGTVRIGIADNLVTLQDVVFHGGDGTLRATGSVRLDSADPNVAAQLVADRFELFATPDRQLSLSGHARIGKGGPLGGMAIDGEFGVNRARFDMPSSAAPRLGDDVVIVTTRGAVVPAESPPGVPGAEKPASPFAPRATIKIDLGNDFHFRGQGADLDLLGALTVTSAPQQPLRAVGDVHVGPGSTYDAFGRKLGIESGYFTFNGPVDNPGINILAMRRNQEVEAGVRVTGTVRAPLATLVSEPSVADDDKLSWLLFGHGTDSGTTIGQQSTVTAALGLLGQAAGGKRIAQTIGLDEFSVGQSDSGLLDPPVVSVAKALSERFILGYEQALRTTESLFKVTWQVSRKWSVVLHAGKVSAGNTTGADLLFNHRYD